MSKACRENSLTLRVKNTAFIQVVGWWQSYTMSPLSQTRGGTVSNQILFAYLYSGWWFGDGSIYKQSKVMVRTHSSLGINWRKLNAFEEWGLWHFYICVNAMKFKYKGNKEIKLKLFGSEVAEGCVSHWHVQWTEKLISMSVVLHISVWGVTVQKEN